MQISLHSRYSAFSLYTLHSRLRYCFTAHNAPYPMY